MNDLIINSTNELLGVHCTNGLIEISGCSISKDSNYFFKPVLNWIKEYVEKPATLTTVSCKIEYIDSDSLKHIFKLFKLLVSLRSRNYDLHIIWHIYNNDPELKEIAEILQNRLKFKFTYSLS